ncbi:hypothetical protein [Sphingobacterium siyangense]|uniref:hypothetical protein n=1 Tax=Sphingobacterium siyangense TaxID=459529 RepID=UPI003DA6352B
MKRVLFVINSTTVNSGGGHYYSLLTISKALKNKIEFKILNTGLEHSQALLQSDEETDFIKLNKSSFFKDVNKIKAYIESYQPDILHAFDLNALRILRATGLKLPTIFSQCGGKNNSRIIADADAYICFSQENIDFLNRYKRNKAKIFHIPNRVNELDVDHERVESIVKEYSLENTCNLLRISRFSTLHELSIFQSISLFLLYNKHHPNSKLIIIGIVQDKEVFKAVKEKIGDNPDIILLTDSYYTRSASSLLPLADIIIATGRGVMEASFFGKPIYCPLAGSVYPVPFNKENTRPLFYYNFSGRSTGIEIQEADLLKSFAMLEEMGEYSRQQFNQYFNINSAVDSYLSIYHNVRYQRGTLKNKLNFIIDLIRFLK